MREWGSKAGSYAGKAGYAGWTTDWTNKKTQRKAQKRGGFDKPAGPEKRRARASALTRGACCAMLLALLGVCGYMGASREESTQAVSVPITQKTLTQQEIAAASMEEIRGRLEEEREAEIALLDSVLADTSASVATKDSALSQKTQIAARMENEAQTVAALEMMGFRDVAAVCGAQTMTVITPAENVQEEIDRTRMIDAVVSQTGMSAESVKIILLKK